MSEQAENTNKEEAVVETKTKKRKSIFDLSLVLYIVLVFIAGFIMGFFVGNKTGLQIGKTIISINENNTNDTFRQINGIENKDIKGEPAAVYGKKDSNNVIKVFSDFQSRENLEFVTDTISNIRVKNSNYRIEYYDFPLGVYSTTISVYARCAESNGIDYIDYLKNVKNSEIDFNTVDSSQIVSEKLLQIAENMGADGDKINLCVVTGDKYLSVAENKQSAVEMGVESAPSFIILDNAYSGVLGIDDMLRLIEENHIAKVIKR